MAVVQVAVVLGGNCSRWQLSGWQFSGGSCPGGCSPNTMQKTSFKQHGDESTIMAGRATHERTIFFGEITCLARFLSF